MARMNGRNPEFVAPRVWSKGALLHTGMTPMKPAAAKPMTADRAETHLLCIRLESSRKVSRAARRNLRGKGCLSVRIAARDLGLSPSAGVFEVVAALEAVPGVKAYTHTEVV